MEDSNTHLTDFEEIKDFVVSSWVKPSKKNSKKREEIRNCSLSEFD